MCSLFPAHAVSVTGLVTMGNSLGSETLISFPEALLPEAESAAELDLPLESEDFCDYPSFSRICIA